MWPNDGVARILDRLFLQNIDILNLQIQLLN